MFFKSCNSDTCSLCRVFNILQSFDKTALKNCIFVSKSLKGWLPSVSRIKLSYGRYWLQMQYMFGDSKYRIYIQSEYRKIRTRNNSVFGHFSRSESHHWSNKHASYIPWLYTTWDQMAASNMIRCVLILMTVTITQASSIKCKECLFIIIKLITHI